MHLVLPTRRMTISHVTRYSSFLPLTNTTEGLSFPLGNVKNGRECICICLLQNKELRMNSTSYLIFYETVFLRPLVILGFFLYMSARKNIILVRSSPVTIYMEVPIESKFDFLVCYTSAPHFFSLYNKLTEIHYLSYVVSLEDYLEKMICH